ncbi:hypothetical protein EJ06DRAFT_556361 [Trichodelitschia bisporula]|uniref:GPI anchored protein n=1 Tax=Trichodelitschia bisporula TaxID=703511 RepID=A0A6G1HY47_9PEZI|nr:hypothetical protein EJ06DRAFT_556361 [Trichodelitschia bisporula]
MAFRSFILSACLAIGSASAKFFDGLDWQVLEGRQLRPAANLGQVLRRGNDIRLNRDAELVFAEYENGHGQDVFASTVRVSCHHKTVLVLEELEHLFREISCSTTAIEITFASREIFDVARTHWIGNEMVIVTSQPGCNLDGERAVYKTYGLAFSSEGSRVLMWTTPSSFKESFDSISVDFGYTSARHSFGRHRDLARRAIVSHPAESSSRNPSSSVTSATTSATTTVSTVSSVSRAVVIPASPSPLPLNRTLHFNLSSQAIDTKLPLIIPEINATTKCKNCTTSGSLELVAGNFVLNTTNLTAPASVIQSGTVELKMTDGFRAHLEFKTTVAPKVQFSLDLFTVPVQGFTIPGLGRAGLNFVAGVTTVFDLDGGIEMTYGMEVDVPRNSSLILDVGKLSNSGSQGFNNTQINSLPLNLNASFTGSAQTSLVPRVPLGFSFFNDEVVAEVSALLHLPALNLTVRRPLEKSTCFPYAMDKTREAALDASFALALDAHILVNAPALQKAAQFGEVLGVPAGDLLEASTSYTLFELHRAVATNCLFSGTPPSPTSTAPPKPTGKGLLDSGPIKPKSDAGGVGANFALCVLGLVAAVFVRL